MHLAHLRTYAINFLRSYFCEQQKYSQFSDKTHPTVQIVAPHAGNVVHYYDFTILQCLPPPKQKKICIEPSTLNMSDKNILTITLIILKHTRN